MKNKFIYLAIAALSSGIMACQTTVTEQKPTVKLEVIDTLPPVSTTNIYELEEGELDSLRIWVLDNIRENFKNDPERSYINVIDLALQPVEGNKYLGNLKTKEKGKDFAYELDVVYDGDVFEWQIK